MKVLFCWDYFRRKIDLIRSPMDAGASLIERLPPDLGTLSDLKNRFEPKYMYKIKILWIKMFLDNS